MYERKLLSRLRKSRKSVLLLGPRQVGKSTLLAQLAPDVSVNLASPSVFRDYVTRPGRLEDELRGAGPGIRTILIDEVQRVPALLDVLQVVIDERPDRFRFLLSGSSARKLRRGNANLLPGRVHVHYLHPLLATELGGAFDLDEALARGLLPGVWAEEDRAERELTLRSYVDSYLREEIQAEALVRDVGAYARMLELVAASSGRILNLQALCGDAGVAYETARRYLGVLEDTLVAFRVPAWTGSDRSSLLAHPKVFLFDIGVRNALLRRPLDAPLEDDRGLLLEHFVAQELHGRAGGLWPEARLHHFRTKGGAEVDFLLEIGREIWAIEVKASRDAPSRMLTGIKAVSNHVERVKRHIVVFLGKRRLNVSGIEVLPVGEFLKELPS